MHGTEDAVSVKPVSVVGLGAMGSRVARRLLGAGYPVTVWNRSPASTAALADLGAVAVPTPAEAAAQAEMLITMVAVAEAPRAVTEGRSGVAAGAHRSLTVIEMSTAGPAAAARPLLSALGTVVHAGPPGSGAAAKLVANMALFCTLARSARRSRSAAPSDCRRRCWRMSWL